jgi:hypothetical protein
VSDGNIKLDVQLILRLEGGTLTPYAVGTYAVGEVFTLPLTAPNLDPDMLPDREMYAITIDGAKYWYYANEDDNNAASEEFWEALYSLESAWQSAYDKVLAAYRAAIENDFADFGEDIVSGELWLQRYDHKNLADDVFYYICATHKKYGTCKNNNVSGLALERLALASIRRQISILMIASEDMEGGVDTLQGRKRLAIEGMIDKALASIRDYQDYLVKSYEHFIDGVIDEAEHKIFKDGFNRQIEAAERNISSLRRDLDRIGDDAQTQEMIAYFSAHGNISALDRRAVASLIDSIIVYDSKEVEIRLRYLCDFDDPPEFAEQACLVPALEGSVI